MEITSGVKAVLLNGSMKMTAEAREALLKSGVPESDIPPVPAEPVAKAIKPREINKSEESSPMTTLTDPNAAWNEAVNDIVKADRISPEMAAVELASNPRYSHIAKAVYASSEQARTLNEMAKRKKVYGNG